MMVTLFFDYHFNVISTKISRLLLSRNVKMPYQINISIYFLTDIFIIYRRSQHHLEMSNSMYRQFAQVHRSLFYTRKGCIVYSYFIDRLNINDEQNLMFSFLEYAAAVVVKNFYPRQIIRSHNERCLALFQGSSLYRFFTWTYGSMQMGNPAKFGDI